MERGAFTAVVDLDSGQVRKLPVNGSLAYFDPSCDPVRHTAVFTQLTDDATRLVTVDTAGKTLAAPIAKGELTSAVPAGGGAVLAADGHQVVRVDSKGRTTRVAAADGTPTAIHQDAAGGVDFLDQTASRQVAKRAAGGHTRTLATAAIGTVGLAPGASGKVFLTGTPAHRHSPARCRPCTRRPTRTCRPRDGWRSRSGVTGAAHPPGASDRRHRPRGARRPGAVTATAAGTGKALTFAVPTDPTGPVAGTGRAPVPVPDRPGGREGLGHVRDAERDVRHDGRHRPHLRRRPATTRACRRTQPTPNQVEWAVDRRCATT